MPPAAREASAGLCPGALETACQQLASMLLALQTTEAQCQAWMIVNAPLRDRLKCQGRILSFNLQREDPDEHRSFSFESRQFYAATPAISRRAN
jgi:hypothetical protein